MPASLPPSMSVPLALFSSSAVDEEFETVSTQLLKRTQAMLNKYRLLLLEESRVGWPSPPSPGDPATLRSLGGTEGGRWSNDRGGLHRAPSTPRPPGCSLLSLLLLHLPAFSPPEGEPLRRDGHDRPNVYSGGEDHPCLGQTASQGEAW